MSKQSNKIFALLCVLTFAFNFAHAQETIKPQHNQPAEAQDKHGFGVAAFDRFHDVLHPLQHEALPNNDFKTIRTQAATLARLGRPLVKMKAPHNITDRAKFTSEQKRFGRALRDYQQAAARDNDDELKTSYIAVHDSFEELAQLLPRK